jgi:hypothetical protein
MRHVPWSSSGLHSCGILHGIGQQLVTDILGQPMRPIFMGQAVQECQEQVDTLLYGGSCGWWLVLSESVGANHNAGAWSWHQDNGEKRQAQEWEMTRVKAKK